MCGDFNFEFYINVWYDRLKELLQLFNCRPMVELPTIWTKNAYTMIDHICIKFENSHLFYVFDNCIADHRSVYLEIRNNFNRIFLTKSKFRRSYNENSISNFYWYSLSKTGVTHVNLSESFDYFYKFDYFYNIFLYYFNMSFPERNILQNALSIKNGRLTGWINLIISLNPYTFSLKHKPLLEPLDRVSKKNHEKLILETHKEY